MSPVEKDVDKRDDVKAAQEKPEVPLLQQIYFYLTQGCNLACRHCWLAPPLDPEGEKYAFLTVETFKKVIEEAKPLGLQVVKLTGGEPLLHPRFIELLGVIRAEGLSLTIETNGVLCTPDIAREIAKSEGAFVSVSIDGINAETHEWVRGVKGSFQKACDAVVNLAGAGLKPQVIMTVMRKNISQIRGVVSLAEKLGAASVKFNVVQPTARGENIHDTSEALDIEEIIRIGRWVETELSKDTDLDLFFDYPMAFRSLRRISTGDGCGICGILGIIGVLPDGRYALCGIGTHISELIFGTAGQDRLEDVWNNAAVLKELRQGLPGKLGGVCTECLMNNICLGSCVAQSYYRTGNLWSAHWFCEGAARRGLFPESRLKFPRTTV